MSVIAGCKRFGFGEHCIIIIRDLVDILFWGSWYGATTRVPERGALPRLTREGIGPPVGFMGVRV